MITTGSIALKRTFLHTFWRNPKDMDYLVTPKEAEVFAREHADKIVHKSVTRRGYTYHVIGYNPIELEVCDPGTTGYEFIELRRKLGGHKDYLTPYEVGLFKLSHRYLKNSPHFKKTMDDILQLRSRGWFPAKLPESSHYFEWFKKREKETLSYKHPDLTVKKDDFFRKDTGVDYVFDHDTIHEAVAVQGKPAYTNYLADGATVKTDKTKFFSLPLEQQLLGPLEESYVLALERHQIPNDFKPDRRKSFEIALMKVCTSITSGWFREFAWENHAAILALYNENYVDKFKSALEAGKIAPYTGK
jgi:hypothetical protein